MNEDIVLIPLFFHIWNFVASLYISVGWRIYVEWGHLQPSSLSFIFSKFIIELPRIMPFQFDNIIREDSYAQIMCVVTEGDPPFTIAWSFHGNNNLTSNSDLQIRTSNIGNRTSLLMIPQVNYEHMGNYTCKVTNNAGRSIHTATLKVNGILYQYILHFCRREEEDLKYWPAIVLSLLPSYIICFE